MDLCRLLAVREDGWAALPGGEQSNCFEFLSKHLSGAAAEQTYVN